MSWLVDDGLRLVRELVEGSLSRGQSANRSRRAAICRASSSYRANWWSASWSSRRGQCHVDFAQSRVALEGQLEKLPAWVAGKSGCDVDVIAGEAASDAGGDLGADGIVAVLNGADVEGHCVMGSTGPAEVELCRLTRRG